MSLPQAARRPVWALAAGQMLGYACIYYVFAALVVPWHEDLGWDKATLALGPMLAILVSAVLAPFAGRMVDMGNGPRLLAGGAALGAVALGGLALVQSVPQYLTLWAVIGVAQAVSLYEICFAVLVRGLGDAARAAIIRVTLVAGFASTLAFPAGALLAGAYGWRVAVWVAAGVMLAVVLPLNLWGARRVGAGAAPPGSVQARGALGRAIRGRAFWLLALVFALSALNHWMIVNLAVPVFTAQGAGPALAVFAASCIGPAQVAGRLLLMAAERRAPPSGQVAVLTIVASVAASLLLWLAGIAPLLVLGFAILQGAAVGIVTILRPVMLAEVVGREGYGAISGVIQLPALVAGAVAPVLGAVVLGGAGVGALVALSLGLLALMLAGVLALRR